MDAETRLLVVGIILVGCCLGIVSWLVRLAFAFYSTRRPGRAQGKSAHRASEAEFVLLRKASLRRGESIQGASGTQSPFNASGTSLDTSTLNPRIRRVRQDYVVELHLRPRSAQCQRRLVRRARGTLRNLSFFRHRVPEPAAPSGQRDHEE